MSKAQNRFISSFAVVATAVGLLLAAGESRAQSLWDLVGDKVKESVEQGVSDALRSPQDDSSQYNQSVAANGRSKSIINASSDFVPGQQVIFQDDFTGASLGSMPGNWKTNGSGSIVTLDGIAGKWLALQDWSVYKLKRSPQYPEKFTIEFDVVAATDQIRDLSTFTFGFDADNSVGDGSARSINEVDLHYMNGDGGSVRSNATDYHRPHEYQLEGFANRVMHVAISVDGENMKVYLNGSKIADARLFLRNPAKYFFLEAPSKSERGSALLVGNFRIAALD